MITNHEKSFIERYRGATGDHALFVYRLFRGTYILDVKLEVPCTTEFVNLDGIADIKGPSRFDIIEMVRLAKGNCGKSLCS